MHLGKLEVSLQVGSGAKDDKNKERHVFISYTGIVKGKC